MIYNVHIYREMRLVFEGIEAGTPEAAAAIARDKQTSDADDIDDCDGESFSALVDVKGDEEYEQSRFIDFEPERERKAAPKLLAALEGALSALDENQDGSDPSKQLAIANARAAIAEAKAAGIVPGPVVPGLLASLEAVLPYAENEAYALEKLKDSPEAEREAAKAWEAIENARAAAQANAAGIPADPAEIDVHALLSRRRQIACIWSVEDVQQLRSDLTEEQAWEVLQAADRDHDAGVGINWDVLRFHAGWLHGDVPETDEEEGAGHE